MQIGLPESIGKARPLPGTAQAPPSASPGACKRDAGATPGSASGGPGRWRGRVPGSRGAGGARHEPGPVGPPPGGASPHGADSATRGGSFVPPRTPFLGLNPPRRRRTGFLFPAPGVRAAAWAAWVAPRRASPAPARPPADTRASRLLPGAMNHAGEAGAAFAPSGPARGPAWRGLGPGGPGMEGPGGRSRRRGACTPRLTSAALRKLECVYVFWGEYVLGGELCVLGEYVYVWG